MRQTFAARDVFRRSRANAGFTFIELLLVVVIIIVLASLLSSALNNLRHRTQQVTCLNNLKQLHAGWLFYVDDNEDRLPLNRTVPSPIKLTGRRNTTNSWAAGNPKEDLTTDSIRIGSIFRYTKNTGLYRCPSDTSTVLGAPQVLRTRSYAMNAYLSGDEAGLNPRVKTLYSELRDPGPSLIFVFIEEHEYSPWHGGFQVFSNDRFTLAGTRLELSIPAVRHDKGSNLSFADGHVEHWKWNVSKETRLQLARPLNSDGLQRDHRRLEPCIPKP